nr:hypothetical protein [Actinomycetota bacterium]
MVPAVSNLPAPAAAAASDSVGAALAIAGRIGPQAGELIQAARSAYVESMGDAVIVAAAAALLGAIVALVFLPARPRDGATRSDDAARPLETVAAR